MNSTLEQVQAIACDIFGIPSARITADSSPETVETWDSIHHLNLVLAIEEKFQVQLSPEEIQEMKSVGAVAVLVESKLQSSAR